MWKIKSEQQTSSAFFISCTLVMKTLKILGENCTLLLFIILSYSNIMYYQSEMSQSSTILVVFFMLTLYLLRAIGSVERCWSYIYYVFLELVWSPVCLFDILLFSSKAMKQAWLPFLEVRECHSARNQNGLTHKAIYAYSVSLVAITSNFPKGRLCYCLLKVYILASLQYGWFS